MLKGEVCKELSGPGPDQPCSNLSHISDALNADDTMWPNRDFQNILSQIQELRIKENCEQKGLIMRKVENCASLHWFGIAFIAQCWSADKKRSKVEVMQNRTPLSLPPALALDCIGLWIDCNWLESFVTLAGRDDKEDNKEGRLTHKLAKGDF